MLWVQRWLQLRVCACSLCIAIRNSLSNSEAAGSPAKGGSPAALRTVHASGVSAAAGVRVHAALCRCWLVKELRPKAETSPCNSHRSASKLLLLPSTRQHTLFPPSATAALPCSPAMRARMSTCASTACRKGGGLPKHTCLQWLQAIGGQDLGWAARQEGIQQPANTCTLSMQEHTSSCSTVCCSWLMACG